MPQTACAQIALFGMTDMSFGPPPIFMFFFITIFVLVIGGFVFAIGRGIKEWTDNNQQPILTVSARVVAKRTNLSVSSGFQDQGTHAQVHPGTTSSTSYYATFEFASGDRKEFSLPAKKYGLLAEQDSGQLTFQGTRFVDFCRPAISPPIRNNEGDADIPLLANEDGFCPYCGLPVRGDFKFCPQCSKPLPQYTAKI